MDECENLAMFIFNEKSPAIHRLVSSIFDFSTKKICVNPLSTRAGFT